MQEQPNADDHYQSYMLKNYSTYKLNIEGHNSWDGDPWEQDYFFCECGQKLYLSCDQVPGISVNQDFNQHREDILAKVPRMARFLRKIL